ncbi:AraC family transcriptional regulator [Priestia filamentosa]|uniref:AraC family transcriptional regulator n=1 Tax=Priestia filamentosa TaxID=1402861 RepID=UPI003982922A
MVPYVSFKSDDKSAIALEVFHTIESVPLHCHNFQEFVLITKGSCIHHFNNFSMPLIPGDVFLVPPHEKHGYTIETPVSMYNCQFYPNQIADWWNEQFGTILSNLTASENNKPVYPADLNRQHIIHLSVQDAKRVQAMMDIMLKEQTEQGFAFQQVKQDYLNLILVIITRARLEQYANLQKGEHSSQNIVTEAQQFIEENLAEQIDFSDYARVNSISPGYFRATFKAATGLPPVEYLNRLRMVRAIEYLKNQVVPISEVAATVGIYDANYFSRLFRKFIGYSPREFRNRVKKER